MSYEHLAFHPFSFFVQNPFPSSSVSLVHSSSCWRRRDCDHQLPPHTSIYLINNITIVVVGFIIFMMIIDEGGCLRTPPLYLINNIGVIFIVATVVQQDDLSHLYW